MLLPLIRKWLRKRLGIHLSIIPDYFLNLAQDGTLLARILLHYHVIKPEEFHLIEETRDPAVAYQNYFNYISKWLARINLELTDGDIYEISHCHGSAGATIFYELYMKLENKQGLIFPPKPNAHQFKIEKVSEYVIDDLFIEANPLCEPLIKQWDVIHWEKDHLASIMLKYVQSRQEYDEYLEQKKIDEAGNVHLEDTLLFLKAEKTDYTYDQLIVQQKAALEIEEFEPNMNEAKKIMRQIKRRNKKRAERTAHRVELQHLLLTEVWKQIAETEEQEFDKVVCEKLLKQSKHEKEIAEKIIGIRKQKEIMIENRKKQDEIDQKQRDEEFVRKLFEDSLEDRIKFHEERMALIAEHQKLYAKKLKIKAIKRETLCKEIVEDIVDVALKTAEYKQMYGVEPDQYIKRNWATLFIKQQPIFDLVSPQDLKLPPEDMTAEIEEIYRREIKRQDTLDEQDLYDHIYFKSIWLTEEGSDQLMIPFELGMNCLGYIVHKLLLKKYPLPIPQKPSVSPEIEISVCANNMEDLSRLDFLKRLLELRNIKVMRIEDATNFCIQAYESELKTEYDDPFPEEEYMRELTPKRAKSDKGMKKGKKDKKGKGGKKKDKASSKKSKGSKKDKKGKKGKKGKGASKTEIVQPTFEVKQAQTPRLFPWERIVFSNKARLGRIAKEILGQEKLLDDKILVDMFVEYLQSLKDIKGWVLVNYPNTYEQAALLEQALSGKPVPKDYYDKILNKESLSSIEMEESTTSSTATPEENLVVTESPKDVLSAEPHKLRVNIHGPEEMDQQVGYERVSTGTSEFSTITITEDWHLHPEERVGRLLPDLKRLAYSSDDEIDDFVEAEETKTCICICNSQLEPNIPENVDICEHHIEEVVNPQTAPQHHKPVSQDNLLETTCTHHDPPPNTKLVENEHEIKKLTDYEQIASEPTNYQPETECTCYIKNATEAVTTTEVEEEITQTQIPGLEQEIGGADDQPLERALAEDVYEERRLSKIVPNPRPLEKEEYNSVLTAYIKIMPKEEEVDEDEDYPIPIFAELEKKNGLEKFYCDQGCYYLLQYEEFNADTIKCLAKMIIGDYSLPLKTSVEIFGERYKEAFLEDGDHKIKKTGKKDKKDKKKKKKGKKDKGSKSSTKVSGKDKKGKGAKDKKSKSSKSSKSKKSGKSKKDKKGKKGKKGKETLEEAIPIEHEDKEVQVPIVEDVEEEEIHEPRAGEPDWEYINLPIPDEIELSLATLWDNFEANYIINFKDLFYNKRVLLKDIVPFLSRTRETMSKFIARPDEKQFYLRQFQKTLNEIDLDLRSDPETKTELLCRIEEFKEKLLGICDAKMRESEEERRNFVRQNWLFHQFCEMTNNTAIAFQLELDRLVDTLQFLSDYYIAVITKSVKDGYEFHKEILPKQDCNVNNSDKFNNLFIEPEGKNEDSTQFHNYIEESKKVALAFVESMKPLAFKPFADMKKIFDPNEQEKKPKKKPKSKKGQPKPFEPDEEVKENADRIFEEWDCALNGELARMNLQLTVIRDEAFHRFDDAIMWIKKIFGEIYENISKRYENELTSVHKACELLMFSVEQEAIIQPELTFDDDQLAQIEVTLFPDTSAISEEDYTEGAFKIGQLEYMVKILFDVAHTGYILRKTFLLLIQDILYQDDLDEETETPQLWRNLSTQALNALFRKLFDDEKYLYWKDFIICNLNVPFPTREQLMDVRRQFRQYDPDLTERVTREEFDSVVFWFEDLENIDLNRLKSAIFRMYHTDEDDFNYTAMLLDFCKDKESILGFVKALELSLGKFICYDAELGNAFVTEILEDRILFEKQQKEHEETVHLAKKAVSLLIDKIIDQCEGPEGFALTELEEREDSSTLSLKEKSEIFKSGSAPFESSEGKIICEHKFSYTQIGFEARNDTELAYFLPQELVSIVASTEVTWNSEVEDLEADSFKDRIMQIYESCRNEKFNNVVLAHEFLNSEELKTLFDTTRKFLAHNPVKLVKQVLYDEPESVLDSEESLPEEGSKFTQETDINQTQND